jgi:nicotinate-nucleotide adenylyltransferase
MTLALQPAIGILGGTFDPVHLGHLRMGIELGETFQLAKVHIIPCHEPVHRAKPSASPLERLEMVKRAVADEPSLFADDREIRRQGPSYMIETVLDLRNELPNTPLCLLIGIDAFLHFQSWYRWQEILTHSHLIVAYRPPYQLPTEGLIADLIKERLQEDAAYVHAHLAGGILLRPMTALEIAASDIRKQIAMQRNPRYLLPDVVLDYIHQQRIYY